MTLVGARRLAVTHLASLVFKTIRAKDPAYSPGKWAKLISENVALSLVHSPKSLHSPFHLAR
jgi:hypothetical protein